MRKKSLLLLLLMAMFAPWAAMAQETVEIGTDGGTTNNSYLPGYTLYDNTLSEQIYTAEEVTMAGTISSIAFYNGGSTKSPTVTLYMVNTDKEAFSSTSDWLTVTSSDKVYEGSVTFTAGEWTTITLDTPFDYDGSSNLGLVAHVHMDQYSSGLSCRVFTSTDNCSMYAYRDNTVYNPTNPGVNASGRLGVKNQIKLEITPSSGVVCDKPETFEASNVTSNSATLTWTGGSGNYNVEYKLASETEWTSFITNTTATTCNLTGLTPGSAYQARVQSACGTDPETGDALTSGWKSVNFTTACGAITTFPWTETFERYASGNFSDPCWVNEHISGSGTSVFQISTSSNEGNSTHQLQLPDMSKGTLTKLVLPEMTLPENYEFSIDIYRSSSTYNESYPLEGIRVYASTNGEIEGATELAFIPRHFQVSNDVIPAESALGWYTYELPIGMSGTCYIILRGESQYCTSTYMDNLAVKEIPTCLKPTGLAVTANSITAHSATITWTSDADAWQICLNNDEENLIDVTETTYTFTGLTSETSYSVKVRTNCDGDYSEFTLPVSFTTAIACPAPTSLVVNYQGGTSATFTWTETGSATSWDIQYSTTADFNDITTVNVYDNPSFELTGLALATTYYVRVNAFCDADGISAYTNVVSFTTDLCMPENQCLITFDLTDSYGDGWNGAYIDVVDVATGTSLAHMSNNNTSKASETETYTLSVCDGREIQFVWHTGNYDSECSFVIKDVNEEVIANSISTLPDNYTVNCTTNSCRKPTNLTASEVGPDFAILSWTENGEATEWTIEVTAVEAEQVTQWNASTNPYTIYLTPETAYSVRVLPICEVEKWSDPITFTTLSECPAITDVTVSNITHYDANVSWTGYSESFNVFVGYNETAETYVDVDFEDQTIPSTWINSSTNAWSVVEGNNGYCIKSGNAGVSSSTSEISFTYTLPTDGKIEFDALCQGEGTSTFFDHCDFYIDNNIKLSAGANIAGWNHYSFEVTEGEHTFRWAYTKDSSVDKEGDAFSVDNINLVKVNRIWNTPITVNTNECALTDLTPDSEYFVKVVASCNATEESEVVSFTTMSANHKLFITEGNWSDANNWSPAGVPTIEQDVELRANVTITGEAEAANITGTTGTNAHTLTIADGGKLKHLNAGVTATVKKSINPWTENGGYYLIANPTTANYTPKADGTDGILAGNYDLYSWSYDATDGNEWRNYKANAFSYLNSSNYTPYGYLYANEAGTTLSITGTIKAANASLYRSCSATTSTSYDFPGWYLLGNGFVCDAYLAAGSATGNALPFIRMKADGTGFENVAAGTAINPFEGVFFEASSEEGGYSGYVYVTTTQPTVQNDGKLNINLRSANKQLDNAILVFGGNQRLGKMSFRANSSKIYMPVEGKDYAITNAEGNMGEMPVSFKAENNGTYSLSFNAEEVSFAYLHLIDNMTGKEVNLLETPSYSFEANTTDYANRFRLVFATGNNGDDDTFAFFSNGSFVINNEGNATVQVIDVNGRILSSENINGCANLNVKAAAGVYMIRLVNGDNVKVQKVVVK